MENRKIYLTHLKQTHMPEGVDQVDKAVFEEVAFSQFNVAQAILKHPHAVVMDERLCEDYTPYLRDQNQNAARAKKLFSEGLPTEYKLLSQEQKSYLANRGGAITLFDLEKLSHVYKTSSEIENKLIQGLLANGFFEAIYEPREICALDQVIQVAKKICLTEPNKACIEILLNFGSMHDFEAQIKKYNNASLVYAGCIETANDELQESYSNIIQKLKAHASLLEPNNNELKVENIPSEKCELPAGLSQEIVDEGIQVLKNILRC